MSCATLFANVFLGSTDAFIILYIWEPQMPWFENIPLRIKSDNLAGLTVKVGSAADLRDVCYSLHQLVHLADFF